VCAECSPWLASVVSLLGGAPRAAATPAPADGLDDAIAATLKANPGAVQIGDREIELEPGLTVTLTGGNDDTPTAADSARPNCPYKHFCIWVDSNFGGARLAMYYCRFYNLREYPVWIPYQGWDDWGGEMSSYQNNQTPGTVAYVYSDWGSFHTGIGWSSWVGATWNDQATGVRPCL
jgi:hypothetical protein